MGQGVKLFGDGFAFWYTKDKPRDGPVLGSADEYTGLGLMFDTYDNEQISSRPHPYITAFLNDASKFNHEEMVKSTTSGGCSLRFRKRYDEENAKTTGLSPPSTSLVKITYDAISKRLHVETDLLKNGQWKECTMLENVELPSGYYFGLSASTGHLADNHDIFGLTIRVPTEVFEFI